MTNWAKIFTGLLSFAYDGIHQMRTLVFDNYQTCTVPFNMSVPRRFYKCCALETLHCNQYVLLYHLDLWNITCIHRQSGLSLESTWSSLILCLSPVLCLLSAICEGFKSRLKLNGKILHLCVPYPLLRLKDEMDMEHRRSIFFSDATSAHDNELIVKQT